MNTTPAYVSPGELASMFNVDVKTMNDAIQATGIKVYNIGPRTRRVILDDFMAAVTTEGTR